jgi:hydrogenase/urease accessory protein HupE
VIRPLVLAILLLAPSLVSAHEVRPGYLEITQTGADVYDVLWKVPARGDLRLRLDVVLPPECEPISPMRRLRSSDAFIDTWSVRCEGGLAGRRVVIAGLSATQTDVLVRFERLDATSQITRARPSSPGVVLEASPGPWRTARVYLALGVEHILLGIDHLLFVAGLMLLVKRPIVLVETITAFTVAHSLTLAGASLGLVSAPTGVIETLIALSIVFVGAEIVRDRAGHGHLASRWPWIVALAFGLLHGFGFAGALSDLGLPQGQVPMALLAFNVGVEIGQLMFVAALLALAWLATRLWRPMPRWAGGVPAYAIGGLATFWFLQRLAALG